MVKSIETNLPLCYNGFVIFLKTNEKFIHGGHDYEQ
jgi:hypothetical protein